MLKTIEMYADVARQAARPRRQAVPYVFLIKRRIRMLSRPGGGGRSSYATIRAIEEPTWGSIWRSRTPHKQKQVHASWQFPVKQALRRQLDPAARPQGLSLTNKALAVAILVSVALAVLETEQSLSKWAPAFRHAEFAFGCLFAMEYFARLWIAAPDSHGRSWMPRLRWALTPAALIDLLAFAPMLLLAGTAPTSLLRLSRLARVLRLAKLGRFSRAWAYIVEAVYGRRYELTLTLFVGLGLMLVSATCLYLVEGPLQPEKFGSIPRALWWSVITLTTIGYGDVYPESGLGRFLAAITAMLGIGLIAAPTGILASAFSEASLRRREEAEREKAGGVPD